MSTYNTLSGKLTSKVETNIFEERFNYIDKTVLATA